MNRTVQSCWAAVLITLFFVLSSAVSSVAAETKIAVLSIQDVLTKSSAGMAAKGKMENRMKELRSGLEKGKNELLALQDEMKKKASVWSEEKKQEAGLEFQKKRNDLSVKQDNANLEMRNLEKRYLNPIMEKLEGIVKEVAGKEGYTVVLPSTSVLYFNNSVDITAKVITSLNAKMK